MTASTIATIVVAGILIFFVIWGYLRGFLRLILTTMLLVVTIVLAALIAPHVTPLVQKSFIGKGMEKGIGNYLEKNVDTGLVDHVEEAQDVVIEKLPLPKFVRKDISEKNTAAEYLRMQVNTFTEYLKTRLTGIGSSVVTYLILLILIYLVVRIILRVCRVITRIPIIGGINRLLGALIGLLEGLLIIWVVCLLVMLLANTKIGFQAMQVIESNAFLRFFYDNNGIILGANALFQTFL